MLKTMNKIARFENMAEGKGVLEAYVELEVRDNNGKLTEKRKFRSGSFVANLLRLLRQMMIRYTTGTANPATTYVITATEPIDHTNTARGIIVYAKTATSVRNSLLAGAIEGETDFGIRVGRGTATPTPTDYNLETPIAHGSSANQLLYGAVTIDTLSIVGNTVTLGIIRTFTNNSGASIAVSELGLSVRIIRDAVDSLADILVARDLIAPPVSVPYGSTLTLRYLLKTTV
jgi:hypothetical protein